ncbi:MAG: hypothetical protein JWN46_3447 [Acidimicrobiales bacterium]|nr:hypothetical protein [Acidimicrobiales bacterium]
MSKADAAPVGEAAPGSGGRFRSGLLAVTAVAFAGRVAYALTKHADGNLFDEGDAFYYSTIANNLAKGHLFINPYFGRPAADHPPLTSLILTPTSWLFSHSVLAQRLTMTLLGTAAVAVIGLLGREVGGDRIGLLAATIAALNPNLWVNDALVMSESLSTLLIAALMLAGCRLARRPTMRLAIIAGGLCGVTVLARAEIGLFLPLMIWAIVLTTRTLTWRERIKQLAASTAACLLVIAPWTILNLTRFQRPVPISTNDGLTLYGANCPATYSGSITGSWSLECTLGSFRNNLDASQNSSRQRSVALRYVRTHLSRLPVVELARHGRVWGWWRPDQAAYSGQGEGRVPWVTWAGYVALWALLPVTLWGGLTLRRRDAPLIPFVAPLLTVLVVTSAFYGIARFRIPFDVAMCVLAAVGISSLTATTTRPRRPLATPVADT